MQPLVFYLFNKWNIVGISVNRLPRILSRVNKVQLVPISLSIDREDLI